MRISLNWLRELVDLTISPEDLAQTLTMAGFEVEDIEDRRTWADGVVVGRVINCTPHPNADKLRVCQVDIGSESTLNIVCGAPNARVDIYVPIATIGTYLPHRDLKIKPAKLRGVPSEGMICSLAELGLAKESEGIHIFDQESLALGSDVRPLLGLDDVILDLTATANRADALSMVGVAREVAALTGAELRLPSVEPVSIQTKPTGLSIKITESQACPVYIGTAIAQLQLTTSPGWLQRRLQAAGVRPINNVVDITNYVLLEWGQPLHAFDWDRLQAIAGGDHLTMGVRYAQETESLQTLDGQTRTLHPQTLLITANDQPVALAGVMGGEATEVNEDTKNILLEAALFESIAIRRSARSQGLRTEASARYERGVNQAELELACGRALQLLSELAQGVPIAQVINDTRPAQSTDRRTIELRLERVRLVLGQVKREAGLGDLQPEEIEEIFQSLNFQVEKTNQGWMVTVPSYRARDLEREIDLIEEIARLYGYDNFGETLPSKTAAGYLSGEQLLTRLIRSAFRASGLTELMHYSLVKPGEKNQVELANPLFAEYAALRTNLIAGLIDAFGFNLEQGNGHLNGFEIGRIFRKQADSLQESDAIAGIIGGDPSQGNWIRGGKEQPLSWYEAKGILESGFERLGLIVEYRQDDGESVPNQPLHPGRTASLWIANTLLGIFGQLHPQLSQTKGLPEQVYLFQFDLAVLLNALNVDRAIQGSPLPPTRFQSYSSFPLADRDIAFFVPIDLSVNEITKVMLKAGKDLLESVELFDEYRGENVPDGQRSLAFRLIYRASDRTLTDADLDPVHQKIRDALVQKFAVNLRS